VLVDHLIYAAPDLAPAVADVEKRFGVRAQSGGKHIGVGTHNALLALGPRTYLEILAPDPQQSAPPSTQRLEGLTHGKLAGWAIACDDIDEAVATARRHGYDPGEVIDGQRTGPTGTVLHWRATPFAQADRLVPFLICWGDTEHPASTAPSGLSLESLQIEHPDPPSLVPRLTALGADVEVNPATAPALVAHLNGPHGSAVLR
jgi:Glyoxalase-like domain